MPLPTHDTGRLAGAAYLLVVISGLFCLAYVPSRVAVGGGAVEALQTIVANQSLYRAGIVVFMLMEVAFLVLPLLLHRLFSATSREHAALMVVFALMSIPLGLAALAARMDALAWATNAATPAGLSQEEAAHAVAVALQSSRNLMQVTQLFWGLWLLPLGWLAIKSGRLPRVLGVPLIVGCFGYLTQILGRFLVPNFSASSIARAAPLPAMLGEIGTCLWLLIFGARGDERERMQ